MGLTSRQSTIAWTAALALALLAFGACDRDESADGTNGAKESSADVESGLETRPFRAPEVANLLEPSDATGRRLQLEEPRRYPACRDIFESDGSVAESFLSERERPELVVYGCDPEAYRRLDDGRRYIAYRLAPEPDGGRDLRFVAFDASGARMWTYTLRRAGYTDHFTANFRESFITPLLPHLVCVGTLWAGGTQASCLEPKSGSPEWEGDLGFWSGIPLQGHDVALHGADVSGLTRRYPYSGVEMERTDFEEMGGHSALYATDGRHLFFVPKEGTENRMTAYSFASMQPQWRTELPGRPESAYDDAAFREHEILVVKVGDRVFAFDTDSGSPRWGMRVGEHRPAMAAGPERLYVLVHREEAANLLYALEPQSGEIAWHGRVPTGTLEVSWVAERLVLRSVRAFQVVQNAR